MIDLTTNARVLSHLTNARYFFPHQQLSELSGDETEPSNTLEGTTSLSVPDIEDIRTSSYLYARISLAAEIERTWQLEVTCEAQWAKDADESFWASLTADQLSQFLLTYAVPAVSAVAQHRQFELINGGVGVRFAHPPSEIGRLLDDARDNLARGSR